MRIFTLTLEEFTCVQRLLQFGRAKFFKHKRIAKCQNIYRFDFCQFVFAISYYSKNNSFSLLMVPRISLMVCFVYTLLLIFLILLFNNFLIRIQASPTNTWFQLCSLIKSKIKLFLHKNDKLKPNGKYQLSGCHGIERIM